MFLGGLAWMLALAFVDGSHGVGQILGDPYEYLRTARRTTDLHATLQEYVSRIRYEAEPRNWPVHVAGHPPGALTFFVVLDRLQLGSGFAAGLVVTVLAATTAVAVLVTARVLGAERLARRAAPFLVLGPAAVWQSVSADAMFAAVGRVGHRLPGARGDPAQRRLVGARGAAARLRGDAVLRPAAARGAGAGRAGRRPVVVPAGLRRGRRAGGGRGVRAASGSATSRRCPRSTTATTRASAAAGPGPTGCGATWPRSRSAPGRWWGPAWRSSVAGGRGLLRETGTRTVLLLSGAGVAMVLLADLSQMSRAEVERIWLPFVPWLLLSCALLPDRWRRPALAGQLGFALVVQHLLFTGW